MSDAKQKYNIGDKVIVLRSDIGNQRVLLGVVEDVPHSDCDYSVRLSDGLYVGFDGDGRQWAGTTMGPRAQIIGPYVSEAYMDAQVSLLQAADDIAHCIRQKLGLNEDPATPEPQVESREAIIVELSPGSYVADDDGVTNSLMDAMEFLVLGGYVHAEREKRVRGLNARARRVRLTAELLPEEGS